MENPMKSNLDKMMDLYAKAGITTHCDTFHADESKTCALIAYIFDRWYKEYYDLDVKPLIYRVSDNELKMSGWTDKDHLIIDIGHGSKYDHHQNDDSLLRDPNDPESKYAAYGLVWREIGKDVMTNLVTEIYPEFVNSDLAERAAELYDQKVCRLIDQTDNFGQTKFPSSLAAFIGMNSAAVGISDRVKSNEAFMNVVDGLTYFIEGELVASIKSASYPDRVSKEEELAIIEKHPEFVVLRKGTDYIPASEFKGTTVKAVVSECQGQRNPGCWQIVCSDSENWKLDSGKVPTYAGNVFCHNSGFMAIFRDEESALGALLSELKR